MKNCIGPRMAAVGYVGAVAVADGGPPAAADRELTLLFVT